ncbi:facilitated trehalose transporter Tret1-like [Lutzomyia longipalpis]|uniref:Facilitated trehalose transporter Tret1 n=2 Tax=Lutzomyia longipalpis TaxID=7200 RepID=A0A1B0CUK2_LUTLO|nr:facilitated trehalose transporter Tret1-like [Lutzomyia longipalpis]
MDGGRGAFVRQYTAAFSGTLIMVTSAAIYGWTSPTLPKLLADDSPIPTTRDESSWIVSFMVIGSLLGPFISFFIVDRFGRKISLLVATIPVIIGLILVLVATSPAILYVSRIFCGITYGMAYMVMPMYLGEISSDKIRGSIGTLLTVMAKFGILYVYAFGPYVSITLLAWILLILPALFIATFIWLPESPYFLLLRNRQDAAEKSLKWFRQTDDVSQEITQMNESVKKAQANRATLRELFTVGNRRALIIVWGMGACQQLCGSQAVIAYSQEIFEEVANGLSGSESAIIMAVVQLITAALSSSIVDRMGRRPLLLLSTAGVTVCNVVVGLYFFLLHKGVNLDAHAWLPITFLMIFIVMYTIGLATVPFALQAELFPTNIKALATGSVVIVALAISFGVLKLYQVVSDGLGMHVTFWGFAVFSLAFVIFTYFLIPETKGRSLDAIIQDMNAPSSKGNDKKDKNDETENKEQIS